jgi:hypothetical protein
MSQEVVSSSKKGVYKKRRKRKGRKERMLKKEKRKNAHTYSKSISFHLPTWKLCLIGRQIQLDLL